MPKITYISSLICIFSISLNVFLINSLMADTGQAKAPINEQSNQIIDRFVMEKVKKQKVVKVIDGDSIVLENGQEIRYIGIDAPEISYNDCFGQQAKKKNEQLVLNKEVIIIEDISQTDKEGRYLAYVYVDNIFVNEYLVKEGYAFALIWYPDVRFSNQFSEDQRKAKYEEKGLWGACYLDQLDINN